MPLPVDGERAGGIELECSSVSPLVDEADLDEGWICMRPGEYLAGIEENLR